MIEFTSIIIGTHVAIGFERQNSLPAKLQITMHTNLSPQTTQPDSVNSMPLTQHARQRMNARNLGVKAIQAALDFGRIVRTRGAVVYAIGKKEVQRYQDRVGNLQRFEGVHVVCTSEGIILTAYRNHSFKKLRPGLGFPKR